MGLNDLTIEKLITEINGYKEKMRTIHEEYGRASQDLQDRINVLGYTLNEHLKSTKDAMATTPQRLLNLEMKFVTGDVNESEYRAQRAEFKGLLENNLKSIEEIKQMIDTLGHIETKPLAPGEFKQTYAENKPATVSWVGIGALGSSKSWTPSQPQPLATPAQATLAPSNVVEEHAEPAPAPALPQSNGTDSPTPETTNAPSTTPLNALAATTAPIGAPVESSDITSSNTLDESFSSGPAQDVPKPAKVWELKGGKSKKNVLIGLFQCQDCRVKFREALTREIL